MDNCQLYRTNVLLGGQLQWNISIKDNDGKLYVNDFYLSPIHDDIKYNKQQYPLNCDHQNNVRLFYNDIKDNFYKPVIDSKHTIWEPIYCTNSSKPKTIEDIHPNTYEMGCKRSKYSVTGYQYQFFCPVWIEKCRRDIEINFRICSSDEDPIYNKSIILTKGEEEYHNKFSRYLKNYLDYANLKNGDDKLIYVDPKESYIHGLKVDNTESIDISLPNLYKDLIAREIPLMEFDNIIISNFKDSRLIAKQLFNFNFLFNIEDLLPGNLYDELLYKNFMVKVIVKIDGKELPINDFYNNYEYIPKKGCGKYNDIKVKVDTNEKGLYEIVSMGKDPLPRVNVLDYLNDYEDLSLIDKNKLDNNICHWSLNGNNDYIFNFYKGFGGLYETKDDIKFRNYYYDNSPDLTHKEFNMSYNNAEWCNIIRPQNDLFPIFLEYCVPQKMSEYFSKFGSESSNKEFWVKNTKYKPIPSSQSFINETLYILLVDVCDVTIKGINSLLRTYGYNKAGKAAVNLYYKYMKRKDIGDYLIGVFDSRLGYDDVVFAKFKEHLGEEIEKLNNITPIPQNNITLNKSVNIYKTDGPLLNTTECIYIKNDRISTGLYRYLGDIKPTFIKRNNDINYNFSYCKKIINTDVDKDQLKLFDKLHYSGYNKKYKSIGYYPLSEGIELNPEKYPESILLRLDDPNKNIYSDKIINPKITDNRDGYKWYNRSIIKPIIKEFNYHYVYTSTDEANNDLQIVVKNYLKEYYGVGDDSYILELYKYKITSHNHIIIKDNNDIKHQYEYNINIILK